MNCNLFVHLEQWLFLEILSCAHLHTQGTSITFSTLSCNAHLFFPLFQAAAVRCCDLCYFHVIHHSEKSPEALPRCFKSWPPARRTGLNTHPDIRHVTYGNSGRGQLAFRWICSDFKLWIGVTHISACDNGWCQEANVTSGLQLLTVYRKTGQQPCWHISLSKMDSQGWANSPSLLPAASQLQSTGRTTSCRETTDQEFAPLRNALQTTKKGPSVKFPAEEQFYRYCLHVKPLTRNIPNQECY